jgi:BirA family transcriptional regulator, biotin operon repressor / biotin---[acetyl-CoA-carboxylase] ligase
MTARKAQGPQRKQKLLSLLADGGFHSGERLAKRLRISRGGVWKLVRALRSVGVTVESVPRQGYRLPRAVDLLDAEILLSALNDETRGRIERADVLLSVDSTNRFVADLPCEAPDRAQVCVAEVQTAGRGRRGRQWIAPFGSGLCLSLGWQFAEPPPGFSSLSLAVGIAATRALERLGVQGVGLKWPNDLMWQNRKLGGILIEMRGESAGPARVVIGLGINMFVPAPVRLALAEQQAALVADVREIARDKAPLRNALAAALIEEIVAMLRVFAHSGLAPFIADWERLDTLANAPVKVLTATATTFGTARGVEADGTLLVEVDGEVRRFVSGEVSLRRAEQRTSGVHS